MSGILFFFARLLGRLGFGRRFFHVDAGCGIHVSAQVVDAASGAVLQSAEIWLERPPEGRETAPHRQSVGTTDANGRLDQVVLMRWSYEIPDMTKPAPPPPPMAAVIAEPGYRDARVPFEIARLTGGPSGQELALGAVALTKI